MTSNDDSSEFSKALNPHGKFLWELKTKVDEETYERFNEIAKKAGSNAASILRDYVFLVVHGETETDLVIREANLKREKMMCTPVGRALERVREVCTA